MSHSVQRHRESRFRQNVRSLHCLVEIQSLTVLNKNGSLGFLMNECCAHVNSLTVFKEVELLSHMCHITFYRVCHGLVQSSSLPNTLTFLTLAVKKYSHT